MESRLQAARRLANPNDLFHSHAPPAKAETPSLGVTARAALRAELDGLIAHLYGITEDEFACILTTFPLGAQPVKDAALAAVENSTQPRRRPASVVKSSSTW